MFNKGNKRITKKFSNFQEEEQWLKKMLDEGWILKSYDSEEFESNTYVFSPITNQSQKNGIYKIDIRNFNKREEYLEYKDLFEEAGWTILSKNKYYVKHIFYTESENAEKDIFSNKSSFIEREKRKLSSSLTTLIINSIFGLTLIILYIIFDITALGGVGILFLIFSIPIVIDYFKHKKHYKALTKNEHIN